MEMEPSFEYFMELATMLESDVERVKLEIVKRFLNGESVLSISQDYGYPYQRCRKYLTENAKRLLGGVESSWEVELDARSIRQFRRTLLPRINKRFEEFN